MNRDLTVGKPSKVIRQFCLPLFGSVIFQQLYNIADSLVAGKFIGEDALAAVGNSYEITLLLIAVSTGANIGCSVIVSRYFGEKAIARVHTAVSTALLTCGVICLILSGARLVFAHSLLDAIRTPANIFDDSELYLRIYFWGFPFILFYNVANGIFSALGDSRTPFRFLAVSSLGNIGVDVLFVKAFGMGVAGVAWATFLCQGISCALALAVLFRRLKGMVPEKRPELFSGPILKQIAGVAVPSMLQQSFVSVGNIILQGLINSFGSPVVAGYSAGIKYNNLVISSFATVGNGISNFTSQNLGAKKPHRIKEALKGEIGLMWSIAFPFTLLFFFLGAPLISFFLEDPGAVSVATGTELLRIVAPFFFVVSVKLTTDAVMRGSGHMKEFMIGTFGDLFLRVVLAFIFAQTMGLGPTGIWLAWPVGWIISTIMSALFYRKTVWKAIE